ncbi:probable LRR receptor-like serine/threonine-protein kinase At5g10290 [Vicia villosa]|uniref:probable LRR receptor-like serine/threonine-protein kinase At5g10290 n=1 Tax=Vicia villosa TaxID=3911 RepID=UPI00273C98F1|nr:probable LRR receptor-like serine/threonine-protein kinase At5g10290 [Vicia villosa]
MSYNSGNRITGEIRKEVGNLTSLVRLDLETNMLTGGIPSSFGNLKRLQFLTLSQNLLKGTIPESLSSVPNLINLLLDSNDLRERIPEQLFNVTKYKYVCFTRNKLNCGVGYQHLYLSDNANQAYIYFPNPPPSHKQQATGRKLIFL